MTYKLKKLFSLFLTLLFFISPTLAFAAGPMGIQYGAPLTVAGGQDQIRLTDTVAGQLAETGAGYVRVNFILGKDQTDSPAWYSEYDRIVDSLRNQGLQVVGLMSNESWKGNQSAWIENNNEKRGGDGYNNYIDQYGYAFARYAKHWEGKIRYWEVWNEPNAWTSNPDEHPDSPGGTFIYPSNFAAMLTHTYSQVKYYNHINVDIISGGVFGHAISGFGTGPAGSDYLDSTYDEGIYKTGKFAWSKATFGTYPLDYVGQHIYINQFRSDPNVNETQFKTYLDYVHNVLKKYEGDSTPKKTWITEVGWTNAEISEDQQANNLTKAYSDMTSKSYVKSGLWFKLEDDPGLKFGITRSDGSKKPAYSKFKTKNTYEGLRSSGSFVTKIQNYFQTKGGIHDFGVPYDNGGSLYAHSWDYGYVQDFDGSWIGKTVIFDTGYRVQLGFWSEYMKNNNHNRLKFPTSDEYSYQGGVRQDFQSGYMTWTAQFGVRVFPN